MCLSLTFELAVQPVTMGQEFLDNCEIKIYEIKQQVNDK